MPGPWSETRQGVAFEQTTEWYESDLEENTEYEVDVAFNEDFSDAVRHTFRTQRTDRNVALRSVTIAPGGQPPIVFDDLDFTRETGGAGSGEYNHNLTVVLDEPRRATVTAIAESSQAQITIDPANLSLAAATFPSFTVTVTNSGNTRTYTFLVLVTAPDLAEFPLPDTVDNMTDLTADGQTMFLSGRTIPQRVWSIFPFDFNTKQELSVIGTRGTYRLAVAHDPHDGALYVINAPLRTRSTTVYRFVESGGSYNLDATYRGPLKGSNAANASSIVAFVYDRVLYMGTRNDNVLRAFSLVSNTAVSSLNKPCLLYTSPSPRDS